MAFNKGVDMGAMIAELPVGLDRAVLRVLSMHKGRENAISRGQLVLDVGSMGFHMHERAIRACINLLRKDGHPICSTGGEDGGYWWAVNWDELNDYLQREVDARATDLLEQSRALRATGERLWGRYSSAKQVSMF